MGTNIFQSIKQPTVSWYFFVALYFYAMKFISRNTPSMTYCKTNTIKKYTVVVY